MPATDDLRTVDLDAVEILAEGGPIEGIGSPKGGETYTRARLERIAAANRELADQVKAPNKLGHGKEQRLLRQSGLEPPAAGWLDGRSFRVVDSDDGARLVADAKRVPGELARLFRAGGFRTRSAETSKITLQTKDGKARKVYDEVVTGLAWLGGTRPAVQTLQDIVALYAADEADRIQVEPLAVYEETLPDAAHEPNTAVFEEARGVERESARKLSVAVTDTRGSVPEITLTEDHVKALQDKLGIDTLDADSLVSKLDELHKEPDPKEDVEPDRELQAVEERVRSLEATLQQKGTQLDETREQLRVERRRSFIDKAMGEGRFDPGERTKFEKLYDTDPELATEIVGALPRDETLVREFGGAEDVDPDADAEQADAEEKRQLAAELGMAEEAIV